MRTGMITAVILSLLVLLPAVVQGRSCESCHSSSGNPAGGWVYHPPVISLVHDPFIPPGTEFNVRLLLTGASDYSIRSLSATISLSGTSIGISGPETGESGKDADGNPYIDWTFLSTDEGTSLLTADVDYKVYFKHKVPGRNDEADYSDRLSTSVLIADLDLMISPGTLFFDTQGDEGVIELSALAPVTRIEIITSEDIRDYVSINIDRTDLIDGERATVSIRLDNMTDLISSVKVVWYEDQEKREIEVEIVITEKGLGIVSVDLLWEVGKYTGIAAFILVLIGYFTGGFAPFKKGMNRLFGSAKKRVDFHCALSYITLMLVIVHLAVLAYGPFTEMIFHWEVILGELALLIMIVVSVNGIFQKRFIKAMGYQNWRRIHSWGTYIITALVIIHMTLYGTHFYWLREMIGY